MPARNDSKKCHCEERSDAATMSLRGDEVPAATSYIIVRLLPATDFVLAAKGFARNDGGKMSLRGGRSPTRQSCHCEGT